MKLAGDLACQGDSYLRKLSTRVVKCVEADPKEHKAWIAAAVLKGAAPEKWWAVQTEDTVLFPEGGGQPFDVGSLGDSYCANVQRVGMEVWHLTDKAVEEGSTVDMELDWSRRFDQMQQHTAQHMVSSVFETKFGLDTMCWSMGKDAYTPSYVQLPTAKLSAEQIAEAEDLCNSHIRDAVAVQVASKCAATAGADSVPEGADAGKIRIVTIPGVDEGPCCGTHVASLAQLQSVKLLHFEPKGNTLRIFFVAGARVANLLHDVYHRERALVKLCGTSPDDLENSVKRAQATAATQKKAVTNAYKQLAVLVGAKMAAEAKENELIFHHQDDADMVYMMAVADAILKAQPTALVVCTGDKKPSGEKQVCPPPPIPHPPILRRIFLSPCLPHTPPCPQMLVACSNADRLNAVTAKATEAFQAKGGANKGKWRGKLAISKGMEKFEKACADL